MSSLWQAPAGAPAGPLPLLWSREQPESQGLSVLRGIAAARLVAPPTDGGRGALGDCMRPSGGIMAAAEVGRFPAVPSDKRCAGYGQ